MQGTLSKSSGLQLNDILQLLCHTRQTGCLRLRSKRGGVEALVNITAGAILNAECGEYQDADAITQALLISDWEFALEPELSNTADRITDSVSSLLLKCSMEVDGHIAARGEFPGEPHEEWRPQLLDYTIRGEAVEGGFSEEDAGLLAEDLDFFRAAANRLAERLNEGVVREIGITETGQTMAFCFGEETTFAAAGVNSDLETTVARARGRLRNAKKNINSA